MHTFFIYRSHFITASAQISADFEIMKRFVFLPMKAALGLRPLKHHTNKKKTHKIFDF